jgi:hypothetical protein
MILSFEKPEQIISVEEWKKISADGAPPGVYRPNMSIENMLRWKAKRIYKNKPEDRIVIQKTFYWHNGKSYPNNVNYSAQCKILIQKQEPRIIMSCNGKMAMSSVEVIEFQQVIQEALLILNI